MRRWLFCRIDAPGGLRTEPVLGLLDNATSLARNGDPGSCSFFDRQSDTVELWCHTTTKLVRQLTDLLWSWEAASVVPVSVATRRRPVSNPHLSGRDVRDELAAVSTELALDVLPVTGATEQLTHATAQLQAIAERILPARRQSFLFQCWQTWATELTARQRSELTETAQPASPKPLAATWHRYAEATEQVVASQRSGRELPQPYLMFRQVEATHHRLGIPPEMAAAAALGVRRVDAHRDLVASGGRVSKT